MAKWLLTAATHASGTDRIAEVARRERWATATSSSIVQGDEPLMPPQLIDQVANCLQLHPGADITTLAVPLESVAALLDPNVVKVVAAADQRALYFSRAPIPWSRDSAPAGLLSQRSCSGARRHLGIYAYRVAALLRLAALPPSALEQLEQLEQLRALEHGHGHPGRARQRAARADVNTADDLAVVAALLAFRPVGSVVPIRAAGRLCRRCRRPHDRRARFLRCRRTASGARSRPAGCRQPAAPPLPLRHRRTVAAAAVR